MSWPFVTLIKKFLDLWDTPPSYKGHPGAFLRVNLDEDSLEFAEALKKFLGLEDTPGSYAGEGGKFVRVKATEDKLVFGEVGAPGAHHETHEDGGADEISVEGLSGLLAALQDAGWLRGRDIDPAAPTDGQAYIWDQAAGKWKPASITLSTTAIASAYLSVSGGQLIPNQTWTKIELDTEEYDPGGNFDLVNHRFIAPEAGYYNVSVAVAFFGTIPADSEYIVGIRINNVLRASAAGLTPKAGYSPDVAISKDFHLAANDYVELFAYHNGGNNVLAYFENQLTFMTAHLFTK